MVKVIDNFLEPEKFALIKKVLVGHEFPWFYQQLINDSHTKKDKNCYFTHVFFNTTVGFSSFYDVVKPVVDRLDLKAPIRIKANLYPHTKKIEIHKSHSDTIYPSKAAIFYINTNNGSTILEDGKKIESIENRLLLFDGHKPHQSTSCTNAKVRININFNYF